MLILGTKLKMLRIKSCLTEQLTHALYVRSHWTQDWVHLQDQISAKNRSTVLW